MSDDNFGNEWNSDDGEYNGVEWDEAYDPDSSYWTEHEKPDQADRDWDGGGKLGDTSKDNSWDPASTTGSKSQEDETKAERKARERKESKDDWARVLREAEVEMAQKKLKKEELARVAHEKRKARAEEVKKEAEDRGYTIHEWEHKAAGSGSLKAEKERKIARVLVGVGLAAAALGGVIGWNVSPTEVETITDRRYVDVGAGLDEKAEIRAKEIVREESKGLDNKTFDNCRMAVQRGLEVRNYYQRHEDAGQEIAPYIDALYAIKSGHEVDLGEINELDNGIQQLSLRTFGITDRSLRIVRDFNYYAQACGFETHSEFSDDPDMAGTLELGYLDNLDGIYDELQIGDNGKPEHDDPDFELTGEPVRRGN